MKTQKKKLEWKINKNWQKRKYKRKTEKETQKLRQKKKKRGGGEQDKKQNKNSRCGKKDEDTVTENKSQAMNVFNGLSLDVLKVRWNEVQRDKNKVKRKHKKIIYKVTCIPDLAHRTPIHIFGAFIDTRPATLSSCKFVRGSNWE